ncbi:MAG TPA: serine hydrolase domain-containing protein, partial [Chitinophagaceae bacterium]|nr:serine hydrolase domain-containing protein [Chitinophagaceae bacterium]
MIQYKLKISSIFLYVTISMFTACNAYSSGDVDSNNLNIGNTMVFPGTDWEIRTPESQGVDSAKLNEAINYLHANSGGAGASEVVMIRNGYMIWKGSNIDHMHTINSCTKPFTTTVLGLLIQDGKLALDDFAVEYLPSLDDKYPAYARIKVRHFASMTSGYTGQRRYVANEKDIPLGYPHKDFTPAPPLFAPGTAFLYHDPAIHQLGYILTKIAGEPMGTLFKRRIADPIGLKDWDWKDFGVVDGILLNSPSGGYEGGVHITARQLARFGH